jgi:hypothetical protein
MPVVPATAGMGQVSADEMLLAPCAEGFPPDRALRSATAPDAARAVLGLLRGGALALVLRGGLRLGVDAAARHTLQPQLEVA